MTGEATVQCSKCGFANLPGDQFCGSCGAFLEWEGTPAGAAPRGAGTNAWSPSPTGAPASPPPGAPPRVAAPTPADAAATAAWSSAPPGAGSPAAPGGSPAAADGLIRCPACGIANAAGRTFCQTCGAKLSPTARIETRSREEIAAAVAAVPRAAPPPAPPVGAAAAPSGPAGRAVPKRGGGVPIWFVVVIVLGVLAGVVAVAAPRMLQGTGPASVASAADTPSAPGSGLASAAASAGTSASSAASPSAAASALPAAKTLKLTGASASSILNGDTGRYGPQNAIDGSLKTSWQEGSATEQGQWLEVSFDPATVTAVVIRNGYQASTALFKGNLRLKDISVSVDGGAPISVRLKDTTSAQRIDLTPVPAATHLRITIVSTYPSVKTSVAGTPFDDAAVSEVNVLGVPGS